VKHFTTIKEESNSNSFGQILIGGRWDHNNSAKPSYPSQIQHFAVYSRTLSEEEISAQFQASLEQDEVDDIRFEFGNVGFEPHGRDPYTNFSHPILLGHDGKDYGLESNDALWTSSSCYPGNYAPSNLGRPLTENVYFIFNSNGYKWFQWRKQNAVKIESVLFHTGNNTSNNVDFMKKVKVTLKRKGVVVHCFEHEFPPVNTMNPTLTPFSPLDIIFIR